MGHLALDGNQDWMRKIKFNSILMARSINESFTNNQKLTIVGSVVMQGSAGTSSKETSVAT